MAIYLDYNATAPVRPDVQAVMSELLIAPHNASSVHSYGRHARKLLEEARREIAEHISVFPNEIIFTGSATEANAMVLNAFAQLPQFISSIEHPSILANAINPTLLPVTRDGVVNLEIMESILSRHSREGGGGAQPAFLVSIMLANNETGVIQPIEEISKMTRKYGGLLHTDAVQGLGKIPIDFGKLGVDMMTLSAHKMGGPVGAAALVIRNDLPMTPLLGGGGQELKRRAGTENIPAITGFAQAVKCISLTQMEDIRKWRDAMEQECMKNVSRETMVHGAKALRLPNTSCIGMPGVDSEVQLMHCDLDGFAISAGSACSSGRVEVSHVLKAMQVPEGFAKSSIRVSMGWNTTEEEIKGFTKSWKALFTKSGNHQNSNDKTAA